MSRLAFAPEVNVDPRSPASTELVLIAGWPVGTNALSLLAETLTVIVLFSWSKEPLSALPRMVYERDPSGFLTAVP